MKSNLFLHVVVALLLGFAAAEANAWGPRAHTVIGQAAAAQLNDHALSRLSAILGADSQEDLDSAIADACFWPDEAREEPDWAWSAPLHYVNIARAAGGYDRRRDCPDDLCVTEGIKKYAAELARAASPDTEADSSGPTGQWRSFAFLCHLVADLHQPLHAGFADDRGANLVEVEYHGETVNLHRFWDSALAAERLPEGRPVASSDWQPPAGSVETACADDYWHPGLVVCWTNESHALAASVAYPPNPVLSGDFADRSWAITRERWWLAARRLTLILDAVLDSEMTEGRAAGWRKPGQA